MSGGRRSVFSSALRLIESDRSSPIVLPLLAVVLTIISASALLLMLGKDPAAAMAAFLRGCGFMARPRYAGGENILTDFLSFLGILAPMILGALAVIVGMKSGMFNIGVAGQMLAAGFAATVFVGYSGLPAYAARPLVVLTGMGVGAMMGAAVGYLKYRFNIHEVVSTIMFNYITSYVTGFFLNTYYTNPRTRSSQVIGASARLTIVAENTMEGLRITLPLGIIVALVAVFAVRFLLDRTTAGFEMRAVGANRHAARYAGMPVGRIRVTAMAVSGLLAGLAGVTFYLGYYNSIVPRTLASLGYDAIATAILANLNPVAAIFTSGLITIFQQGRVYMSSTVGAPREIASVISALLLLFCACGVYFKSAARRALARESVNDGRHTD